MSNRLRGGQRWTMSTPSLQGTLIRQTSKWALTRGNTKKGAFPVYARDTGGVDMSTLSTPRAFSPHSPLLSGSGSSVARRGWEW